MPSRFRRKPTIDREGKIMTATRHLIAAAILSALPLAAVAQTAASETQRDINQQQRIQQGLSSGQLTTREAAKLEQQESAASRQQSRALRDGTLTDAEKARIDNAQDRVSRNIARQKNDAQTGNPSSASSQRMQADVQRNINQEQRVKQGIQSGEVTNHEAARLQHGQAKVEGREARAGANGRVGAAEQNRIQQAENRQSHRVYRQKHDAQTR
jgi:hypothetical protein